MKSEAIKNIVMLILIPIWLPCAIVGAAVGLVFVGLKVGWIVATEILVDWL